MHNAWAGNAEDVQKAPAGSSQACRLSCGNSLGTRLVGRLGNGYIGLEFQSRRSVGQIRREDLPRAAVSARFKCGMGMLKGGREGGEERLMTGWKEGRKEGRTGGVEWGSLGVGASQWQVAGAARDEREKRVAGRRKADLGEASWMRQRQAVILR